MTTLIRRPRNRPFTDLVDWFETGLPAWWPGGADAHVIRVEDEVKDGRYLMRAELPGIDPAKDLTVTVERGVLTVRAERRTEETTEGRSEFRYGSFVRSVTLPQGADEDDVAATYDKGIVEVSVGLKAEEQTTRTIPVTVTENGKNHGK